MTKTEVALIGREVLHEIDSFSKCLLRTDFEPAAVHLREKVVAAFDKHGVMLDD